MKTLKIIFFTLLFIAFASSGFAQTKTEKIKVAGECSMCKKSIEKAARTAGASYAAWNTDNKVLTVKYSSTATNKAKIEKAVAKVGYDTEDVKATDEAYNKLHQCCQYERSGASAAKSCCDSEKCTKTACMKDGKCDKDMACCKEAGCSMKDCCQKS